jgi:FAD/FMN-containing dehydrogenase
MRETMEVQPTGGRIVWRGEAEYELARRRMVWNDLLPDRFPDVIVSVATEEDVIQAVRLARSRGLRVAVRSGGHSWIASSLRDGGMLIDLSQLNGVNIAPDGRTATAQPAIRNTEIVAALTSLGLAFPAGHCPTVGLGGYLLAGGQGWNQGTWGPACQNVLAIDLVNADGEMITADAEHNADLLWAARGSGPGFPGVILRYHLRLFPAPASMRHSFLVFPLDSLEVVVPWLAETVPSLSSAVEVLMLLAVPPPNVADRLSGPPQRYLMLWPVTYGSSPEETAAALAPLDSCPVRDQALLWESGVPASWDDLFAVEGAVFPEGYRYEVEIIWSDADPTAVLRGLRDRLTSAPSLKTEILAAVTGPSTIDPSAREMAYSMAAPLYLATYSAWQNAADDAANRRWHQETVESLRPVTRGHYMGETDLLASPVRASESLGPGVWERLQAIRRRYDPDNIFHSHIGQA